LAAACFAAGARAETVREMERKIRSQKKDLEKIHAQIQDLEAEKRKLKKDEESLSRLLKRFDGEIEQSTRKQVRINRQIREVSDQISRVEKEVSFFSGERTRWEGSILGDVRAYHARVVYPRRLRTDPLQSAALRTQIALKYAQMRGAETRKDRASEKERQLLGYRSNLTVLTASLKEELEKQRKSQQEKKKLYQTTMGKRVVAEQEAQRLRDTADSLELLVRKLIEKKETTLAAQQESELMKKNFQQRRGNLPWPVSGTVVSAFGRQKHPDLDIPVVNNGIRLRTASGAPVKAVAKGKVVYAADFRSYGQTVIVDHGGDTYSIYGLLGRIAVKEGGRVMPGDPVGNAADSESPQVYFEFRSDGHSQNPMLWLEARATIK
jgi:septal ring factor EnvC (AmiA/AmiB activator)